MLQDKDFVGDEKVLNMRLQQRAGCQSMLMMRMQHWEMNWKSISVFKCWDKKVKPGLLHIDLAFQNFVDVHFFAETNTETFSPKRFTRDARRIGTRSSSPGTKAGVQKKFLNSGRESGRFRFQLQDRKTSSPFFHGFGWKSAAAAAPAKKGTLISETHNTHNCPAAAAANRPKKQRLLRLFSLSDTRVRSDVALAAGISIRKLPQWLKLRSQRHFFRLSTRPNNVTHRFWAIYFEWA